MTYVIIAHLEFRKWRGRIKGNNAPRYLLHVEHLTGKKYAKRHKKMISNMGTHLFKTDCLPTHENCLIPIGIKIPEIVIQIDFATKRFWYFFNSFFIFLLAIHCNRQNHQSSNKLSIGDLIVRLSSDYIKLKKLARQKFENAWKGF